MRKHCDHWKKFRHITDAFSPFLHMLQILVFRPSYLLCAIGSHLSKSPGNLLRLFDFSSLEQKSHSSFNCRLGFFFLTSTLMFPVWVENFWRCQKFQTHISVIAILGVLYSPQHEYINSFSFLKLLLKSRLQTYACCLTEHYIWFKNT